MSRSQLKLLAVITMLIDHIGAIFFPQDDLFRIIGRLAFPLFCFFIAEGMVHTSNLQKYLGRVFLFALVSEVPYDLAFYGTVFYPGRQNVFFTLFLGLAAISLLHTYFNEKPVSTALLVCACVLLAEALNTDYGAFGVLVIILFYCARQYRTKGVLTFAILNTGFGLITGMLQIYAAAVAVPIVLYNGKRGKLNGKYFFYAFYPVHLLLLYLVHQVAF
jgi:uncharacterized membrane protein YobD (UPF0266 family)